MREKKQKYVVVGLFQGLPGSPAQVPMTGVLIGVSVAGGAKTNIRVPENGILAPVAVSDGQKVKFTFEGVGGDTEGAATNQAMMRKHIGQLIGEAEAGAWKFIWRAMDWRAPARPHMPRKRGRRPREHVFKHLVQYGETLTSIAQHFKTTVSAIKADNRLRSDRIYAGHCLYIYGPRPVAAHAPSSRPPGVASSASVDHAAPSHADGDIRNSTSRSVVHGDKHNNIPARSANGDGHPIALINPPRIGDNVITLTPTDVLNLKKVLGTEWAQSEGDDQAKGIVDTVINRLAACKFGGGTARPVKEHGAIVMKRATPEEAQAKLADPASIGLHGLTLAAVINRRAQFSAINSIISHGRHSVEDPRLPNPIKGRVDAFVDSYLYQRQNGVQSIVLNNLNYANLHGSSPSNFGWINKLREENPHLVFGRSPRAHFHGTTDDLKKFMPPSFFIIILK